MSDDTDMIPRASWMRPADITIMTLLGPPKPLKLPAAVIATNAELSKGYVRNRCAELERRGLLTKEGERGLPYYDLTDLGLQAVKQEITQDELEEKTAISDEEGEEEADEE